MRAFVFPETPSVTYFAYLDELCEDGTPAASHRASVPSGKPPLSDTPGSGLDCRIGGPPWGDLGRSGGVSRERSVPPVLRAPAQSRQPTKRSPKLARRANKAGRPTANRRSVIRPTASRPSFCPTSRRRGDRRRIPETGQTTSGVRTSPMELTRFHGHIQSRGSKEGSTKAGQLHFFCFEATGWRSAK